MVTRQPFLSVPKFAHPSFSFVGGQLRHVFQSRLDIGIKLREIEFLTGDDAEYGHLRKDGRIFRRRHGIRAKQPGQPVELPFDTQIEDHLLRSLVHLDAGIDHRRGDEGVGWS